MAASSSTRSSSSSARSPSRGGILASATEIKAPKKEAALPKGRTYPSDETWEAFGIPDKDKFARAGFTLLHRAAPDLFATMHPSEYNGWRMDELDEFVKSRHCDACEDKEKSGGLTHWWGVDEKGDPHVRFHCGSVCRTADIHNSALKPHPKPIECLVASSRLGRYEKMAQIRGILKSSITVQEQQSIDHFFNVLYVVASRSPAP